MTKKKGVLLINLGSPKSPNKADVKRYLDEFLMDKYVIDTNYLMRNILVRGIILRTRPAESAKAYKKVWTDEGSPLIVHTKNLKEKVQNQVDMPVEIAMRYGEPSLLEGLEKLVNQGIESCFMLPLYPQFAMASTETVVAKLNKIKAKQFPNIEFNFLPPFYNHPDFICVLSESIKRQLGDFNYDHLLFSYHGLPERHIKKSDPSKSHCKIDGSCCETAHKAHETCYRHQCFETTKAVVEYLKLEAGTYSNSFQSRLGNDPWLEPNTANVIDDFPKNGVKKLAVVTPAFVADCLETIEEIGMEAKQEFLNHGGEEFLRIECLNDDEAWAEVLGRWASEWGRL